MLDFYKGMDISFLQQCLEEGMQVYDRDGSAAEPFALLKKYGVNAIRLRIWNDPENVPESGGYCSLERTLAMARQIAAADMSFLLDFHYSDFWADPANQRKPAAWKDLTGEALEEAVYTYTRDTLKAFEAQGTLPDMVQIGNEIRSGLLFPDGELPDFSGMVRLVNAGIRGARETAGPERMQVMIHLDQGGRYDWLHQWFEGAFHAGLADFDVIGLSYYPFWHGTYEDLKNSMSRLAADYKKPIVIAETAYAWRKSEKGFIDEEQIRIGGLPASPEGQLRELQAVMHLLAGLPDGLGKGIYYWEPLCVPREGQGGWQENMGLLDADGKVMEGIMAYLQTRSDMEKEPDGFAELLERTRRREYEAVEYTGENLLKNGNFIRYLSDWKFSDTDRNVSVKVVEGEPGSTSKILRVESDRNFVFSVEQEAAVDPGDYLLTVEIKGVDTTGVDVRLFARDGEEHCVLIHPTEQWRVWKLPCRAQGTKLTAGIEVSSPAIYLCMRNFRLTKT